MVTLDDLKKQLTTTKSQPVKHNIEKPYKSSMILPKFLVRCNLEFFKGKISFKEYIYRHSDFLTNKWQRIGEVMDFNDSMGLKSTFFIGCLLYTSDAADD